MNSQNQINSQKETNQTVRGITFQFEKETSRKAEMSGFGFIDLTLTNKTLEEIIAEKAVNSSKYSFFREEISRGQNNVIVCVNFGNSGSVDNNFAFLIEENEFNSIEEKEKFFKNLCKKYR